MREGVEQFLVLIEARLSNLSYAKVHVIYIIFWPGGCPWDFPGKNTGAGCHFLLQGNLPNPRIELRSSKLQADSLLSEPPGKVSYRGVTSYLSS